MESESTYQHAEPVNRENDARRVLVNFCAMSVLFSANHGAVVSCLALATSQLGSLGAWQSGMLYLTYTGSALLGATYIVKELGPKYSLCAGMLLYVAYVACFWAAAVLPEQARSLALMGAAVGGVGAGFLWTAQGSYFGRAAEQHALLSSNQATSESTAYLGGIFSFIYLFEEVLLRSLSTLLLQVGGFGWASVFGFYSILTVASALGMFLVDDYPSTSPVVEDSVWKKVNAAWYLLRSDPRMKYMIGLNAVFGFTAAFLNSYVNGQVVGVVWNEDYIGVLTAWLSLVAAGFSLVFGRCAQRKGEILSFGAVCFLMVALPFVVVPNLHLWSIANLFAIYTFHGIGRATFEGTLKATFADLFAYEKEGAFANIIVQNGLASAVGYVLTFSLLCSDEGRYCIAYKNGSLHDVLSFELVVVVSAIVAIAGYWRSVSLHTNEAEVVEFERLAESEQT